MQNININKILNFENEIDDLLLISIDDQIERIYDRDGVKISGKILVSGKVREKDSEKEFSDVVDIDIFLTEEEIDERKEINISVNDFTYSIEADKLILNISLKIDGLKEIETTFLAEENNTDIEQNEILNEDKVEENNIDIEQDEILNEDKEESMMVEIEEDRNIKDEDSVNKGLLKTIFSNKRIKEEVSWKLHCVKEEKSYEEIAKKYDVSVENLKKINKNENLGEGKLIFIPLD